MTNRVDPYLDFTGTYDLVGTKILPGLVTLSSDSDYKVQKSAISGLGSIIYAVSQGRRISNETSEKALFQLTSLLSEDVDENRQTPSNMKNVHEINMGTLNHSIMGQLNSEFHGKSNISLPLPAKIFVAD